MRVEIKVKRRLLRYIFEPGDAPWVFWVVKIVFFRASFFGYFG